MKRNSYDEESLYGQQTRSYGVCMMMKQVRMIEQVKKQGTGFTNVYEVCVCLRLDGNSNRAHERS
jgi:hypothetical protein